MSAGCVYMPMLCLVLRCNVVLYISAWASALLVLATVGNAKALNRGTSDRYRFPRFFYLKKDKTKQISVIRGFDDSKYCEEHAFVMDDIVVYILLL